MIQKLSQTSGENSSRSLKDDGVNQSKPGSTNGNCLPKGFRPLSEGWNYACQMVKDFSALPRKLNHSHSQSKPPSRQQGTRDFIILHKRNNGLVPACSLELNFAKRQTMAGLSLVGAMSPGPMPEEWPCWLFGIGVMVSFASPVISEPLERDHSWSFWILAAVVGILFSCSLWYGWIL